MGKPKVPHAVGRLASRTLCHRVVLKDENLTGYALGKGIPTKRCMLEEDGIVFMENIIDLKRALLDGIV